MLRAFSSGKLPPHTCQTLQQGSLEIDVAAAPLFSCWWCRLGPRSSCVENGEPVIPVLYWISQHRHYYFFASAAWRSDGRLRATCPGRLPSVCSAASVC
jgi:hypothetical protein